MSTRVCGLPLVIYVCDHYLPTLVPGSGFQPLPLPEGLPVTSNDIIGSLNEHLLRVLKELRSKEQTLTEMEKDLERYQRKFAVIIHQQVYHSHLSIYLSTIYLSIYLSTYHLSIYYLSIYLSIYVICCHYRVLCTRSIMMVVRGGRQRR